MRFPEYASFSVLRETLVPFSSHHFKKPKCYGFSRSFMPPLIFPFGKAEKEGMGVIVKGIVVLSNLKIHLEGLKKSLEMVFSLC
jgi:hypothetical protein